MIDTSLADEVRAAATAAGPRLPSLGREADGAAIRRAAQEFESVFIGEMLKPMFENLETEEPFGGGHAEQVWRGLQVDEFGKAITRAGGIGLADQVAREMLALQESQG
jgi:Rod binding domain-containing protein